jgi:catechol 2,3-dioxygenase-like lactoylglutathione lyase family enzyme
MTDSRHSAAIDVWHIAIPVCDLERSVSFYCGHLGFELVGRDEQPTMRQAFVSLGKRGFTVELFVPLGEEGAKLAHPPDHIAFEAKDIEAYRGTIVESGLEVPEIEVFPGGMKHFALSDLDGAKLDFFQGRDLYEAFLTGSRLE